MGKLTLREVVVKHRKHLMKMKGVVGIGVASSSSDPTKHCIVVYANLDDWPGNLPHQLEGYEVEVQKTSGFRIL